MTKKMTTGLLLMTCAMLAVYAPARAAEDVFDESRWQLRLRAVGVIPDDSSTVNIGGDADADAAVSFHPGSGVQPVCGCWRELFHVLW